MSVNLSTHSISAPPEYPSTVNLNLHSVTESEAGIKSMELIFFRFISLPLLTLLPLKSSVPSVDAGNSVIVMLSKSVIASAVFTSVSLKAIFCPISPVLIILTFDATTCAPMPIEADTGNDIAIITEHIIMSDRISESNLFIFDHSCPFAYDGIILSEFYTVYTVEKRQINAKGIEKER